MGYFQQAASHHSSAPCSCQGWTTPAGESALRPFHETRQYVDVSLGISDFGSRHILTPLALQVALQLAHLALTQCPELKTGSFSKLEERCPDLCDEDCARARKLPANPHPKLLTLAAGLHLQVLLRRGRWPSSYVLCDNMSCRCWRLMVLEPRAKVLQNGRKAFVPPDREPLPSVVKVPDQSPSCLGLRRTSPRLLKAKYVSMHGVSVQVSISA